MYDDDLHITRELLEAVASGHLPPRIFLLLLQRHLTILCPHCRRELEAFYRAQERTTAYDADQLDSTLSSLGSQLEKAQGWVEELRRMPEEARIGKVERARTRFRGRLFARLLLEEARASLPNDPAESHAWAQTALAAVFYATGQDDLFTLSIAFRGNARRLLGEVPAAREDFAWARRVIRQRGITDTEIYAEVDSLQASLYIDSRDFEEAEHLLSRAAMLFQMLGRVEPTARVLMQLSNLHMYRGELADALDTDRRVLDLLDPTEHRMLYLSARLNFAHSLAESGSPAEARELLAVDEESYSRHPDESLRLRVLWLQGTIATALDEPVRAERSLQAALDGFAERDNGFDVACVSLDLAMLYIRQSRHDEVAATAARAVALFASREVHRDALAALILLRDAAAAKQATSATLRKVATFLKEARTNPAARFEPAN